MVIDIMYLCFRFLIGKNEVNRVLVITTLFFDQHSSSMSKPSLEEGIVIMKRLRSVTGGRPKSVLSANIPTAAAGSEGARSAKGKK